MKIVINSNHFYGSNDLKFRYDTEEAMSVNRIAPITEVRFTMLNCTVDAGVFELVHHVDGSVDIMIRNAHLRGPT